MEDHIIETDIQSVKQSVKSKALFISDEDIVAQVLNKDKNLFLILVDRYEGKLTRYIKRFIWKEEDVKDVLQNIFIKAFENLNSFDDKYKFNSWIYSISHNESINFINKNNNKRLLEEIDFDTILPFAKAKENIETDIVTQEDKDILSSHISNLEYKYKEVIVLHYFEDFSYKEISDILKIPESTVGVRLKRAKDKLKKIPELKLLFK